jgi:hypothetical protein
MAESDSDRSKFELSGSFFVLWAKQRYRLAIQADEKMQNDGPNIFASREHVEKYLATLTPEASALNEIQEWETERILRACAANGWRTVWTPNLQDLAEGRIRWVGQDLPLSTADADCMTAERAIKLLVEKGKGDVPVLYHGYDLPVRQVPFFNDNEPDLKEKDPAKNLAAEARTFQIAYPKGGKKIIGTLLDFAKAAIAGG